MKNAGVMVFRKRIRKLLTFRFISLYLIFISAVFQQGQLLATEIENNRNQSWQITADKITRYTKPDRIIAEGNVILYPREEKGSEQSILQSDWLKYNRSEGKVTARGNVYLKREGKDLTAEKATLDLDTQAASFSEANLFIPKHQLHFISRQIDKESAADIYHFEDGYYTTCPLEEGKNPPWHLKSGEGTLNLDGLGRLDHTVLRIRGVPVFYIPYLPVPLTRDRKTGFLLPEFASSSRSGIGVSTPYFINLSPSNDLTLYPGFLSRKGAALGAEYRYVADYDSEGYFGFSYLNDRTSDSLSNDFKSDGYLRQEENRYWLWGKFYHGFGNRLHARGELDIVSDQDYLQEFENSISRFDEIDEYLLDEIGSGFEEPSLPYRTSRLNLSKTWDSYFLGGEVVGVDDNDFLTSVNEQISTLPHLIFTGANLLSSLPAALTWDTDYVNYWREEGIGEERLDIQPRLISTLPLPLKMEGVISAGIRETIYNINSYGDSTWDHETNQSRTAWEVKAETGNTWFRDFDISVGSWDRLTHSFRPEVAYDYRWVEYDGTLPVIDDYDSLAKNNKLNYSLNNYFFVGGTGPEDKSFENYLGYIKLSQSYDIEESRRDLEGPDDKRRPFSDITLNIDIYPLPRWDLEYKSNYSVYGEGITNYNLSTKYTTKRGDRFALDYRFKKNSTINEIYAEVETKLTDTIFLEGELRQSLETDETINSSLNLIYHPQCWALKFSIENTPSDERIALVFSLVGLGESLGFGVTENLAEGGGLETTFEGNLMEDFE